MAFEPLARDKTNPRPRKRLRLPLRGSLYGQASSGRAQDQRVATSRKPAEAQISLIIGDALRIVRVFLGRVMAT
jgi:hypothetical protein